MRTVASRCGASRPSPRAVRTGMALSVRLDPPLWVPLPPLRSLPSLRFRRCYCVCASTGTMSVPRSQYICARLRTDSRARGSPSPRRPNSGAPSAAGRRRAARGIPPTPVSLYPKTICLFEFSSRRHAGPAPPRRFGCGAPTPTFARRARLRSSVLPHRLDALLHVFTADSAGVMHACTAPRWRARARGRRDDSGQSPAFWSWQTRRGVARPSVAGPRRCCKYDRSFSVAEVALAQIG